MSRATVAVGARSKSGTPKYLQIKGGNSNGLYGADKVADKKITLFCEGEFDALIVGQEAGDLIAPVTLSSATTMLSSRWYAAMAHCHTVLVAYDRDVAGEKGANHLLSLSPRFRKVGVPQGKDISEFYLQGGDVHHWVSNAIDEKQGMREESPNVC